MGARHRREVWSCGLRGSGTRSVTGGRLGAVSGSNDTRREVSSEHHQVPVCEDCSRYEGTALQPSETPTGEDLMTGTVKSYSDMNGYGFINVPGSDLDLKFGKADLAGGSIIAGAVVRFTTAMSPDGRMQARHISLASALPVAPVAVKRERAASLPPMGMVRPVKQQRVMPVEIDVPTGQWATGAIKSYNPTKGFGFISSAGIAGDIFFMRTALPMKVQTAQLERQEANFELMRSAEGKVRAQNITFI